MVSGCFRISCDLCILRPLSHLMRLFQLRFHRQIALITSIDPSNAQNFVLSIHFKSLYIYNPIILAEKNCFQEGTMGLAPESGGNQQTLWTCELVTKVVNLSKVSKQSFPPGCQVPHFTAKGLHFLRGPRLLSVARGPCEVNAITIEIHWDVFWWAALPGFEDGCPPWVTPNAQCGLK